MQTPLSENAEPGLYVAHAGCVKSRRHLSMAKSSCYVVKIYPSPRPKLMYVKKRVNGKITLKNESLLYI